MRNMTSRRSVLRFCACLTIWMCLITSDGCRPAAHSQAKEAPAAQNYSLQQAGLLKSCDLLPSGEKSLRSIKSCPISDCLGNGPMVNRFPINGMNPAGCKNAQGIWLVPGSIQDSHNAACNGHTLDVNDSNELVVSDGKGCSAADLEGASFALSRDNPQAGAEQTVRIKIHRAEKLSYYGHDVRGYVFTLSGSSKSLCAHDGANDLEDKFFFRKRNPPLWISPIGLKASRISAKATALDDVREVQVAPEAGIYPVAIVFRGGLHQEDGTVVVGSNQSGWFNIACARDALAKLDIVRMAPHNDERLRSAALRMATANYCNVKARYTFEGNELEWKQLDSSRHETCPAKLPDGRPREAVWDENGAVCIEHTRLYERRNQPGFRSVMGPELCQRAGHCEDERAYVAALLTECSEANHAVSPSCEGVTGDYCSYSKN